MYTMAEVPRTQFLDQVAQLVAARFPLVKLERNEEEFSLRINGHWAYLENLYRLSMRQPEQWEHSVERWVVELLRAAEGTPDRTASFQELHERIYPMVLSQSPRDMSGLSMVTQQLLEGLTVAYAVDSDRTISYVPQAAFERWGISVEELHEAALANLVARSQTLMAHAAEDENGHVNLILIQVLDGYDSSRILLPGLHERLREHLGSPFLAGIPNRDILVCFRDDPETRQRLTQQIAQDYRTMPHQVSDHVFLITADGIAPYEAERE
jgi:uncharacterized protein YtpQ (UPF0354 family)